MLPGCQAVGRVNRAPNDVATVSAAVQKSVAAADQNGLPYVAHYKSRRRLQQHNIQKVNSHAVCLMSVSETGHL
jgi:hypothetical protein